MDESQLQATHARVPLINKSLQYIFLLAMAAALATSAALCAAQQPDAPAPQPEVVSASRNHLHKRLPLQARPCG